MTSCEKLYTPSSLLLLKMLQAPRLIKCIAVLHILTGIYSYLSEMNNVGCIVIRKHVRYVEINSQKSVHDSVHMG